MRTLGVVCCWVVLAALAAASVVQAFPEAMRGGGGRTPLTFFADTPAAREKLAAAWRDGATTTAKQSLSLAVWRRDPLDAYPLSLMAYAYTSAGRGKEADRAVALALKRNSRDLLAHMIAVQRAVDRRDYARAILGFDTLIRLDGASEARYMRALAQLARDPASHAAILRLAQTKRPWVAALVRELGRDEEAGVLLVKLSGTLPEARQSYLNRLMAAGRVEEAFIAWLEALPETALKFSWPYDGTFRGAPGVGPFNWTYDGSSTEVLPGGGLNVVYLGRGTRQFAGQLVLLGPGYYMLSTDVESQTRARGGRLQWVVTCYPNGPTLVELDIASHTAGAQTHERTFSVPLTGCTSQRILLRGMPGELSLWAKARISAVRIVSQRSE